MFNINKKNFFYIYTKINNLIKTSYFLGFFLSFILTNLSFFLYKNKINYNSIIINILIWLCVILQIFFQIRYFLHLKFSKKNYWNVLSLIFTISIISIISIGSIWVMDHLKH